MLNKDLITGIIYMYWYYWYFKLRNETLKTTFLAFFISTVTIPQPVNLEQRLCNGKVRYSHFWKMAPCKFFSWYWHGKTLIVNRFPCIWSILCFRVAYSDVKLLKINVWISGKVSRAQATKGKFFFDYMCLTRPEWLLASGDDCICNGKREITLFSLLLHKHFIIFKH